MTTTKSTTIFLTRQSRNSWNSHDHRHSTVEVVLQLRKCGLTLLGARDEVKEQVLKDVNNCFKKLKTYHKSRGHHKSAVKKQYKHSRVTSERRLVSTESSVTRETEEKVKEWDRLAEGAEREHWSNTYYLKQTAAGGAGTVATTKHPHLSKANKLHRDHVRRRGNNSTQPQTSSSQWQDWTYSSSSSKRWCRKKGFSPDFRTEGTYWAAVKFPTTTHGM